MAGTWLRRSRACAQRLADNARGTHCPWPGDPAGGGPHRWPPTSRICVSRPPCRQRGRRRRTPSGAWKDLARNAEAPDTQAAVNARTCRRAILPSQQIGLDCLDPSQAEPRGLQLRPSRWRWPIGPPYGDSAHRQALDTAPRGLLHMYLARLQERSPCALRAWKVWRTLRMPAWAPAGLIKA